MVCHRSCPYSSRSAKCAISGGIHKPIHKPTLPIGCSALSGSQACRLAWHGMVGVFFTRWLQTADWTPYTTTKECCAATGHVFCTVSNRLVSFLVLHVAVLLACAAVRSLTFPPNNTHCA